MEVRRVRPDDGAAKLIASTVSRVRHLETRPSGTIYIDEKLVVRNPETGEETLLGQLPDGSWGFQEFVNDVIPPGRPNTPRVASTMGGLVVWWDGKQFDGTEQPKDYAYTNCEYQKEGATGWTIGGTFRDPNGITISSLEIGTRYLVRLVSYDKNKNNSEPSPSVLGIPVAFVDNSEVDNAIAELREADRQNAIISGQAQESAAAADRAAQSAADNALKAIGAANGKGRIIYSPTAPTSVEDRNVNNMWIDTSGNVPKNTPNRWDDASGRWIPITDKAAVDAGVAAGNAEQVANAASARAAAAAEAAGQAQTAASLKNRVWYLPSKPAGNDHILNDIWFDQANGNRPMRWDGSNWVTAQDASIAAADKKAADAAATASSAGTTAAAAVTAADNAAKAAGAKGKVIIQSAAPDAADRLPQNLWIDTTGGANTPKRWVSGTTWTAVTDKVAQAAADAAATAQSRADAAFLAAGSAAEAAGLAQSSADGKNKVWYSTTKPAGTLHRINDLWFDEANGNRPMRWDGSNWVTAQDASIAAADKKAADAAATASSAGTTAAAAVTAADNAAKAAGAKGKVIVQAATPAVADQLPQNLWIDMTGGANTPKRWDTTTSKWLAVTDKAAIDAATIAGKAQTRADDAFLAAGSAAEAAGLAQTAADGKNKVWYSTTAPAGNLHRTNDLWFDEANGNRPMRWNGASWVSTQDQAIKALETTVEKVTSSANGKNTNYYTGTAPTGTTAKPLIAGDIWFDTANGNRVKVWSDGRWNDAMDQAIITAQNAASEARSVADGKNTVYYQSTKPAATTTKPLVKGDTWFDTSKNYQMWTYTGIGTTWTLVQDSKAALEAANGKNKVSTGSTAPTLPSTGDTWIDTGNGNTIKVYSGSAWVAYKDSDMFDASKINTGTMPGKFLTPNSITKDLGILGTAVVGTANIDDLAVTTAKIKELAVTNAKISDIHAGKISAGEIDSDRIGANTISVEKLLVTSMDNLVADADFSDPKGDAWTAKYTGAYSWDVTGGRNGGPALKIAVTSAQQGRYNVLDTPTTGGASYRITAWVKSSVAVPINGIAIYGRQKYVGGGTTYVGNSTSDAVRNDKIIPANVWTPVTGIIKTRDDALTVSFGIFSQPENSTGTLWVDYLSATRASDGQLIVDGSVTSKSVITEGLDAGVIKFGEMDGARIKANTISAEQLMVGAYDNLVSNPSMIDGRSWTGAGAGPGSGWATDIVYPGMAQSYKMTQRVAGGSNMSLYAPVPAAIPVSPGESFYVSTSVYSTGDSPLTSVDQRVYFHDASGTMLTGSAGNTSAGVITSLASGSWRDIGGIVVAPAGAVTMVPRITVYYLAGAVPTSAAFYLGAPKVYRAVGSTLIEKGAVTTDSMTAGTIDGKIISVGTLKGTQIEAKTISTDNLLISSTDNLIQEADFGAKGIGWKMIGTASVNATSGRNGGPALQLVAATGIQTIYNNYTASVQPGSSYRVTAWVKSTVALSDKQLVVMAKVTKAGGTPEYLKVSNELDKDGKPVTIAANTWSKLTGMIAIPDGALSAQFAVELAAAVTSGTIVVDFVSVTRASDGQLIVDGSITTNHMTVGTIDGKVIKGQTITGSEIAAKSISTDNLLITSTDNLIQEADFGAKGIGWKLLGTTVVDPIGGRTGGPALKITAAAGLQQIYNKYTAAVEPGNVYRLTTWVKSTVALPVKTFCFMATPITASGSRSGLRIYSTDAAGVDKVIAANTWTKVSGLVTIPDNTASLEFALEVPASIASGTIYVDFASVARAMDGELVVDGSITTNSIVSSGIDAAVIKTGTLDSARIGAQSITAEKIVVGQGQNVLPDPMFLSVDANAARGARSTGTWTFPVDGTTKYGSAKTTTATGTDTRFMFGQFPANAANASKMVPVTPGDEYLLEVGVFSSVSTSVRWLCEVVKGDGTVDSNVAVVPVNTDGTYGNIGTYSVGTGRRKVTGKWVVPTGVVAFNPVLQLTTPANPFVIDGGVFVSRKTTGALIVDGAINGKTITGALIQSVETPNRGIKLNDTMIVAYNNSGAETLRFDGTNSMITGATVRTAATGARVQIDATGLTAWNAANSEVFRILDGSVNMSGSISANGMTQPQGTVPIRPSIPITLTLGPSMPTYIGGEATSSRIPGIQWVTTGADMLSPPQIFSTGGDGMTLTSGVDGANSTSALTMYGGSTSLSGSSNVTVSSQKGAVVFQGPGGIVANSPMTINQPVTFTNPALHAVELLMSSRHTIPNGTRWGPGNLVVDRNTNAVGMVLVGADTVTFMKAGTYTISTLIDTGNTGASATWGTLRYDSATGRLLSVGEKNGSTYEFTIPSVTQYFSAGQKIKWTYEQKSGATQTWQNYVTITRHFA